MDPPQRKVDATGPVAPGAASGKGALTEEREHFQIAFPGDGE